MKKPKRKPASPAKVKPTPPRNLTPEKCQRLSRDLLVACRNVAETHGLTVEGGDVSDIDLRHGFDIQFRVGIPMPDGSLFSHEKAMFEVLAPNFGLDPSDYGRTLGSFQQRYVRRHRIFHSALSSLSNLDICSPRFGQRVRLLISGGGFQGYPGAFHRRNRTRPAC